MFDVRRLALASLVALVPALAVAAEPVPKYSVALTLSPAAVAKLTKLKEQVTVSAHYYGMPTEAAEKKKIPNEIGEIDLGDEEITRPLAEARAVFGFVGKGFDTKKTKWIHAGTSGILINVYSARRAVDDNILDCGLYQDTVELAMSKPIEIACKLIGE